jgi:metal-sulfur cluster biosynthetic enzyme
MEPIKKEQVLEWLTTVYDPELGVNIVDLGLIYDIQIRDGHVEITMTMTTPGCPMHHAIVGGVERTLHSIDGIRSVRVEVVWDPPWSPDKMSEEAKERLGYFA